MPKKPTKDLKITFGCEKKQFDEFVFSPHSLHRIRDSEPRGLTTHLTDVWKLPSPSLVLRICGGNAHISPSVKAELTKIVQEMTCSTPSLWIVGDAVSSPASQIVGEALLDLNKEFNTFEDAKYNKPVVNIGIGIWDQVKDVRHLELEVDNDVVHYQISEENNKNELNPEKTHFILADISASGVDGIFQAIIDDLECPVIFLHAGTSGPPKVPAARTEDIVETREQHQDQQQDQQDQQQQHLHFDITEDNSESNGNKIITEDNWKNLILDLLMPSCKSLPHLLTLSLSWKNKEFGKRIIKEAKKAELKLKINVIQLYGDEDQLDLDIVTMLEQEQCVDKVTTRQLKKLFPNAITCAEKINKRNIRFAVKILLNYIISEQGSKSSGREVQFDLNYTLLFFYSVVNGSDILAKHFFTKCDSPVFVGLMAAHMLRWVLDTDHQLTA